MNNPAINELKPIPTYQKMPDCEANMVVPMQIRWVVYHRLNVRRLEALYEDGWDSPFWGPIETIEVETEPEWADL